MFSIRYEAAHDRINRTHHTVSGFMNIGFQLSNVLSGESPFETPEPIFRSPRNLRKYLTRPVRRNYSDRGALSSSVANQFVCVNNCSGDIGGREIVKIGHQQLPSTVNGPAEFGCTPLLGGTHSNNIRVFISREVVGYNIDILLYQDDCSVPWIALTDISNSCHVVNLSYSGDAQLTYFKVVVPAGQGGNAGCVSVYITNN